MRIAPTVLMLIAGATLASAAAFGSEPPPQAATTADHSGPGAYVKDSAITAKIKAKLASEHISSLAKIHVDTDANGTVYLSGSAKNQADIDKAVSIAQGTENVTSVRNDLIVSPDN